MDWMEQVEREVDGDGDSLCEEDRWRGASARERRGAGERQGRQRGRRPTAAKANRSSKRKAARKGEEAPTKQERGAGLAFEATTGRGGPRSDVERAGVRVDDETEERKRGEQDAGGAKQETKGEEKEADRQAGEKSLSTKKVATAGEERRCKQGGRRGRNQQGMDKGRIRFRNMNEKKSCRGKQTCVRRKSSQKKLCNSSTVEKPLRVTRRAGDSQTPQRRKGFLLEERVRCLSFASFCKTFYTLAAVDKLGVSEGSSSGASGELLTSMYQVKRMLQQQQFSRLREPVSSPLLSDQPPRVISVSSLAALSGSSHLSGCLPSSTASLPASSAASSPAVASSFRPAAFASSASPLKSRPPRHSTCLLVDPQAPAAGGLASGQSLPPGAQLAGVSAAVGSAPPETSRPGASGTRKRGRDEAGSSRGEGKAKSRRRVKRNGEELAGSAYGESESAAASPTSQPPPGIRGRAKKETEGHVGWKAEAPTRQPRARGPQSHQGSNGQKERREKETGGSSQRRQRILSGEARRKAGGSVQQATSSASQDKGRTGATSWKQDTEVDPNRFSFCDAHRCSSSDSTLSSSVSAFSSSPPSFSSGAVPPETGGAWKARGPSRDIEVLPSGLRCNLKSQLASLFSSSASSSLLASLSSSSSSSRTPCSSPHMSSSFTPCLAPSASAGPPSSWAASESASLSKYRALPASLLGGLLGPAGLARARAEEARDRRLQAARAKAQKTSRGDTHDDARKPVMAPLTVEAFARLYRDCLSGRLPAAPPVGVSPRLRSRPLNAAGSASPGRLAAAGEDAEGGEAKLETRDVLQELLQQARSKAEQRKRARMEALERQREEALRLERARKHEEEARDLDAATSQAPQPSHPSAVSSRPRENLGAVQEPREKRLLVGLHAGEAGAAPESRLAEEVDLFAEKDDSGASRWAREGQLHAGSFASSSSPSVAFPDSASSAVGSASFKHNSRVGPEDYDAWASGSVRVNTVSRNWEAERGFEWDEAVRACNEKVFGNRAFRPMQRAIINAVLSQRDVFVMMPTGGGKSLCFQLPAIVSGGVTVVVMPLVSLITDQLEQMQLLNVGCRAFAANQPWEEQKAVYDEL
ncbi:hypothetical protein TGFOU_264850, partial [Toxoplasma gondii FOU]